MTAQSGDFIRVRDPHPLSGMTGVVVATVGAGRVVVTLTAWGIEQTFDAADLRHEQREQRVQRWHAGYGQREAA